MLSVVLLFVEKDDIAKPSQCMIYFIMSDVAIDCLLVPVY